MLKENKKLLNMANTPNSVASFEVHSPNIKEPVSSKITVKKGRILNKQSSQNRKSSKKLSKEK